MHSLLRQKAALNTTIHNQSFTQFTQNDHVAAAVFPALKALQYCDSNTPAMDKIYFLVHCANEALLNSKKSRDDENLFGLMKDVTVVNCELELEEVFGEANTERQDEMLRNVFLFLSFLIHSNNILVMIKMITMCHWMTQSALHGISMERPTGACLGPLSPTGY